MKIKEIILQKRKELQDEINSGTHPDIAQIKIGISPNYDALSLIHKAGVRPVHIFEAGTSNPEVVQCRDEILRQITESALCEAFPVADFEKPVRFSLLDVRPEVCMSLDAAWGMFDWIRIYACAIHDGSVASVNFAGHSTFVGENNSPCLANNAEHKIYGRQEIQTFKFSEVDDGTIDVLLIDLEGNEWFVLNSMHSTPFMIQLETHILNPRLPEKEYINPHIDEISEWMNKNDYVLHALTDSDSIFIHKQFEEFLKGKGINSRL